LKYWYDTEFIEDGKTIDLISIGIVCEDGREFYAESLDADLSKASAWVRENVLPHLFSQQANKSEGNRWSRDGGIGGLWTRADMKRELKLFIGSDIPEFWAYYADYDHVALCQLFGTMMDLPNGWPMYTRDVKQYCDSLGNPSLPEQGKSEHNALADARWTRDAYLYLRNLL